MLPRKGLHRSRADLLTVRPVHIWLLLAALLLPAASHGDAYEQSVVNQKTTLNLINALVRRGILSEEEAQAMIRKARSEAENEVARERVGPAGLAPAQAGAEPDAGSAAEVEPVHVYYVPQEVKDSLRSEIAESLAGQVEESVKVSARKEKWGVPAALPAWVNRFHLFGDLRLRAESTNFADDNQPFSYFNFLDINRAGGTAALQLLDPQRVFLNTTQSRTRFRARLRLALDADLGDGLDAGIRLSTSNDRSPIGLNQTLGQTGQQYEIVIDRLFARYRYTRSDFDWLTVQAGRHPNPWFSSETLFDRDLNFEGLALTGQLRLNDHASTSRTGGSPLANFGVSQPGSVFLTLGASSLAEFEFSEEDRFLLAGQAGIDWEFRDDSRLKFAVAYYDYNNVAALPNSLGRRDNDFSAPLFFTKGNSLTRISNDIGESLAAPRLVGLASDFNLIDVTGSFDYSLGKGRHAIATASFTRNSGFSRREILDRTGLDIEPRVNAYEVRLDVGEPVLKRWADWIVFGLYKYVERDALLDAFTESIFHLAGTDAKGWEIGGRLGLSPEAFLAARWASSDAIDGPPLGIDVILLDLNIML